MDGYDEATGFAAVSPRRFCEACGGGLSPGDRFCTGCGRRVPAPGVSADHGTRPPRRPGRVLRWVLVAGLVLVAAAGVGVWLGLQRASAAGPELPTPDQSEAIARYGQPSVWVVADGEPDPGLPAVRFERWWYPERGQFLTFFNGVLTQDLGFTPDPELADAASTFAPTQFDRSMTAADVEAVLGEDGQPLDPVATSLGLVDTRAYDQARLVVQYLEDHFYSAQTM